MRRSSKFRCIFKTNNLCRTNIPAKMRTVSVIKVPTRLIEKNGKTVEESNYYELAELDNSESLHYGLGAVDSGIATQVNFILQHMMK